MGPLTDIQDNIEKLRSLQESLHDLCTFISTLDLTSGAKEDTLLQGIADLKDAFANIDLSSLETTLVSGLNEVKDAVSNINFTDLENSIGEVKDAIDAIPTTDLTQLEQAVAETAKDTTLNSAKTEIITAVNNAKPDIDLSAVAKETTLATAKDEIIDAVNNSVQQYDAMIATQLEAIIG